MIPGSQLIKLSVLSEITGIEYFKIRNNFIGKYDSLSLEEKQLIIDTINRAADELKNGLLSNVDNNS